MLRVTFIASILLVAAPAAAEPRELRLADGTVVGAIAVGPPPEWAPVEAKPDTYQALLGGDGPWMRIVMGSYVGERERPSGAAVELTLGRPVDAVPYPPRAAFRAAEVDLRTASGQAIATVRCATTEVLERAEERTRVRLYREGPSGERYVLEGWVDTAPEPSPWCEQRVAYVDTGAIPAFWARVPDHLPRFTPRGAYWRVTDGRCARWVFYGSDFVHRETTREGQCVTTTETRRAVSPAPHGLRFDPVVTASRSTCGGVGMGMGGSSDQHTLRLVSTEPGVWRWLRQTADQDPIAYHPDDAEVWYRQRAACEASLASTATPR